MADIFVSILFVDWVACLSLFYGHFGIFLSACLFVSMSICRVVCLSLFYGQFAIVLTASVVVAVPLCRVACLSLFYGHFVIVLSACLFLYDPLSGCLSVAVLRTVCHCLDC